MSHTDITHSSNTRDNEQLTQIIMDYATLELKTCEHTDHKTLDIENDIDPDNHFFSNIKDNCYYYTDPIYTI